VAVDTDIDPGLRLFRADAEELHLALLNLCKNASDAMPCGGTISIGARNVFIRPDGWWVRPR
jgi:signal transduction histidine kinase